jgi:hypothetical protein
MVIASRRGDLTDQEMAHSNVFSIHMARLVSQTAKAKSTNWSTYRLIRKLPVLTVGKGDMMDHHVDGPVSAVSGSLPRT